MNIKSAFSLSPRTFVVPLLGVALYYIVSAGAVFLMTPTVAQNDLPEHYVGSFALLSSSLMLVVLVVWFLIERRQDSFMPDKPFRFALSPLMLPMAFGLLGLIQLLMKVIFLFAEHVQRIEESIEQYTVVMQSAQRTVGLQQIFFVLGVAFISPVAEELLCRGLIQKELSRAMPANIAVVLSSLIFALIHGLAIQSIYAFVAGLFLGFLYRYTGNLIYPIIVHIIFNLLGGILSTSVPGYANVAPYLSIAQIILIIPSLTFFIYLARTADARLS